MQNPKNVILGHLNINFIKNKIEAKEELMQSNIDISLLSETKLNGTFSNSKFIISDNKMFRRDRNEYGGVLCFI